MVAELEKAGLYGLAALKKSFSKEVEGYSFYSVTVRGFKFQKTAGCAYAGSFVLLEPGVDAPEAHAVACGPGCC